MLESFTSGNFYLRTALKRIIIEKVLLFMCRHAMLLKILLNFLLWTIVFAIFLKHTLLLIFKTIVISHSYVFEIYSSNVICFLTHYFLLKCSLLKHDTLWGRVNGLFNGQDNFINKMPLSPCFWNLHCLFIFNL